MAKSDGGPAFPASVAEVQGQAVHSCDYGLPGMSLRDWFAGQALIAIGYNDHVDGASDPERHAATAYRIADAMIAAREQP